MKYDEELIKIVKNKNFKTFWHCFDYLVLAGYSHMDAFGVSLQEFGESRVFSDVAFIRRFGNSKLVGLKNVYNHITTKYIKIGLIDASNIHLSGLYSTYRTWIVKNEGIYEDVEGTCEIIDIPEFSPFLMDYLLNLSKLHYGFEAFKYVRDTNTGRQGYTAEIDPRTGLYNLQAETNELMRIQQDLEALRRI